MVGLGMLTQPVAHETRRRRAAQWLQPACPPTMSLTRHCLYFCSSSSATFCACQKNGEEETLSTLCSTTRARGVLSPTLSYVHRWPHKADWKALKPKVCAPERAAMPPARREDNQPCEAAPSQCR